MAGTDVDLVLAIARTSMGFGTPEELMAVAEENLLIGSPTRDETDLALNTPPLWTEQRQLALRIFAQQAGFDLEDTPNVGRIVVRAFAEEVATGRLAPIDGATSIRWIANTVPELFAELSGFVGLESEWDEVDEAGRDRLTVGILEEVEAVLASSRGRVGAEPSAS